MSKLSHILMCTLATLIVCQAAQAAQASKPMETFKNIPIQTASGKVLTLTQVQAAIIQGGTRRHWVIKPITNDTLAAHIDVRQHSVDLIINADTQKYSIAYKNSTNLGYKLNQADLQHPLIHPSYNKWLHNLISDIEQEFQRD